MDNPNDPSIDWFSIEDEADLVFCIGSGPSLSNFKFDILKTIIKQAIQKYNISIRTISVNGAAEILTWTDYAITCDTTVLKDRFPVKGFEGTTIACMYSDFGKRNAVQSLTRGAVPKPGVEYMIREDGSGLSAQKDKIHGLANSGFGALNLASLMAPNVIVLLGYDFNHHHSYWYQTKEKSKRRFPYEDRQLNQFHTASLQLETSKVKVLNGSRDSLLPFWDRLDPGVAVSRGINLTDIILND